LSLKDGVKLANTVEIAKGEYDTKQFIVFTEADPISTDGKNRWQDGINTWVATLSDGKYHPPTDVYQGSDSNIVVSIKEPGDSSQVGNSVTVKIEAATNTGSITKIELYVDGSKVKEYSDAKVSDTISLDTGAYRTITAKATDSNGKTADTTIHVGANHTYETPTPTLTPTSTP
jgi:hypothetical protein